MPLLEVLGNRDGISEASEPAAIVGSRLNRNVGASEGESEESTLGRGVCGPELGMGTTICLLGSDDGRDGRSQSISQLELASKPQCK